MNGSGRLSLRARLLVVLIAVTAVFLLIMGGVTALVLSKRLGAQFDESLVSAAARSPGQIQANPGDYVAVTITRFPLTVQPLTGDTGATAELASAVQQMIEARDFRHYLNDTPFTISGTSPRRARDHRAGHRPQPRRGPGNGERCVVEVVPEIAGLDHLLDGAAVPVRAGRRRPVGAVT